MGTFTYQPPHQGRVRIEQIVRPFSVVSSGSETQTKPKRLLPGEDTEAFASWGQTANFSSSSDQNDPLKSGGGKSGFETEENEEEDQENVYTEEGRSVSKIKVASEDDEDTFIMVEVVNTITMSGPNGKTFKFVFNND